MITLLVRSAMTIELVNVMYLGLYLYCDCNIIYR